MKLKTKILETHQSTTSSCVFRLLLAASFPIEFPAPKSNPCLENYSKIGASSFYDEGYSARLFLIETHCGMFEIHVAICNTSYICSRRCPEFLLISLQMNHICTYNIFLKYFIQPKNVSSTDSLFERLLLPTGVTRKCWNSFLLKFAMAQSFTHNSILVFPT